MLVRKSFSSAVFYPHMSKRKVILLVAARTKKEASLRRGEKRMGFDSGAEVCARNSHTWPLSGAEGLILLTKRSGNTGQKIESYLITRGRSYRHEKGSSSFSPKRDLFLFFFSGSAAGMTDILKAVDCKMES